MERWILPVEYDTEKFEAVQAGMAQASYFGAYEAAKEFADKADYLLIVICPEGTQYLTWLQLKK